MSTNQIAVKPSSRSFVLFSLVGLTNTVIDYLVFFSLYHLFPEHFLASQVISYSCGTVNSFFLNKYWTFRNKNIPCGAEILKFIVVNALALSISYITLDVVSNSFGLDMFICKTFATGMSFVVNYFGSKFWVFLK
ncbi:GtrA family protein [Desulfofarcimen acetoxidans DSM 771]|uniref:GtrA family protein n=1 Tax=Desulfofarcimen acetoxidans (strain ATCC 49208 / DSM 771 / KCTC 5769 / VKM B-1644 / 5575) TaxID=485916 RepID=C8W005_DESAS|nr:GtrA family protein [Desulfofarcimen acetoxidans]ACV64973.1 GtrA family protein [Desulfofarcimen acetoxidans DSM 771]